MEQCVIDWTVFLADDVRFLPDPPPAGVELVDAPSAGIGNERGRDEISSCSRHPDTPADCYRRHASLIGTVLGIEEEVAALGHFGVGFPEGLYPETVPGSFTATTFECGKPASITHDDILDMDGSQEGRGDCVSESARAGTSWEDDWQGEPLLLISGAVDPCQRQSYGSELDMSATDEAVVHELAAASQYEVLGESLSVSDEAKPQSSTPAHCPTSDDLGQCVIYQEDLNYENTGNPTSNGLTEDDDCVPELAANTKRRPKKKRRKHNKQSFSQSSELIEPGQSDSDSDYAPDSPKKMWARRAYTRRPAAAAKLPRKRKEPQVWRTKSRLAVEDPRSNTKNYPRPARDTTVLADYAPVANKAQFAASATRARFALEATTLRRQPGVPYGDPEDAQHAFCKLQERFYEAKQRTVGVGTGHRNKQQVLFADKAGDAVFARHAVAAEVLIKVG
ncbi:hypothetical protein V2A60_009316 [Cordyceps javanica]